MLGGKRFRAGIFGSLAALGLPGCVTIQAIEPVISPPADFRSDVAVEVEFAQPGTIGFRCAERGATFFGLPGINSGACADSHLITMVDPCSTVTAGPYARVLCDGLQLHRRDAGIKAEHDIARPEKSSTPTLTRIALTLPPSRKPEHDRESGNPGASVRVEFLAAADVELRCAERGAKMFEADAAFRGCGDRLRLTITNPCDIETTGWYARTLCHEMAHVNGWPSEHPTHGPLAHIRLASQSPQALALAALEGKRTAETSTAITAVALREAEPAAATASAPVQTADTIPPSDETRLVLQQHIGAALRAFQASVLPRVRDWNPVRLLMDVRQAALAERSRTGLH